LERVVCKSKDIDGVILQEVDEGEVDEGGVDEIEMDKGLHMRETSASRI
jgi:hypothetical protein